jgi:serine/threonine protein kinase/tetratricopeptide (TPR) repeat protein
VKHWAELKETFWGLVDREAAEQARELAVLASADPELYRQVEALLAADARGESLQHFLEFAPAFSAEHPTCFGPFEITGVLGAGGMGEVYRARDSRLQREVAIKVLPAVFAADRERLLRFEREARLLASLNHPHIAQIHGLEEYDGRRVLVMELVEGPTLAELIASYPDAPIALPTVLSIASQISDGLAAAHEKGIVHRDLKPANIALTCGGSVKLLDFGVAKTTAGDAMATSTITAADPGIVIGTPAYMSPEQARGLHIDKRADIWAFGCVLYELLTGRPPFTEKTAPDTIAALLTRAPDMTALPAETPKALRSLVRHCLEKEPEHRLADIGDARIAIEDLSRQPAEARVGQLSGPDDSPPGAIAGGRTRLWTGIAVATVALSVAGYFAMTLYPPYRAIDRVRERTTVGEPRPAAIEVAERSVAVLPFTNMSGDPDNEPFCDGISEEILNRLAGFRELRVMARTSSFAFKGSDYDISRMSSLLGVKYLLQGSVRKEGEALRIAAQLVDGSGFQVWSATFDRELTGIFAIQAEIAEAVATSIVPQISAPPVEESLPDIEAYQHYLVGRELVQKRTAFGNERPMEELDQAIAIDPDFAEAYAERAIARLIGGFWTDDPSVLLERAERDIDKALSLKPELARAHAARALLLGTRNESPEERERILRRALALDPNMVDARNWLSGALSEQGRDSEADQELERAARLDPLAPAVNANIADREAARGDIEAAERRLRRLVELPQPPWLAYAVLWWLYTETGQLAAALDVGRQALLSALAMGGSMDVSLGLIAGYVNLGLWDKAEYWQRRWERESPHYPALLFPAAVTDSGSLPRQGRFEEAVALINATLEEHELEIAGLPMAFKLNFGTLQALSGSYEDAIRTLEPLTDSGKPLRLLGGAAYELNALQALAWAYREAGNPKAAATILDNLESGFLQEQAAGRLHSSHMRYRFALNALLAGSFDLALERLQRATEAGWRDYYMAHNDPRWRTVAGDARYLALMAAVKADVDAQRAEVERQDAEYDFAARLDSAVANRAARELKRN